MNRSSGIKRGLATTAVAALAVTGIPFAAFASPINDQVPAGDIEIFTPSDGSVASTQNDGVNNSIHLLAGADDNVAQIRFEYDFNGNTVVIATVSRTNGAFSTEWTPVAGLFNQNNVVVRAVGLNLAGQPLTPAVETESIVDISTGAAAVDIANAEGSTVGVFRQPYAGEAQESQLGIFSGTTSGAGAIQLTDESTGSTTAPAITPGAANAQGIRAWSGTANFEDYTVGTAAGSVNEAVVRADQVNGSEDAEAVVLQRQLVSAVTAVASPATVPSGTTGAAVVTVNDAAGRPIAGAQVVGDTDRDGVLDAGEPVVYTNAAGQARFANLAGSAAGITYDFYVNTTDGDDFESAVDFRRQVVITSVVQNPTVLTVSSDDGAAFDTQEFATGDITVRVADQSGNAIAGRTVNYTWTFTPAAAPQTPVTGAVQASTTNADGDAVIAAPLQTINGFNANGTYVLNAYIDNNGTPGQQAGEPAAAPFSAKAGDSSLTFAEAPLANSVVGSTDTYEASLRLFDGTPLTGRLINFGYAPTGNSTVAAQTAQPAGTTRTGNNSATDTTDANGVVSVAITDPATPATPELDNELTAATANTGQQTTNAGETGALEIDFVSSTPPANSTVTISPITDNSPGRSSGGSVTVTSDDADPNTPANPQAVANLAVTLTVSGDAFVTSGGVRSGGAVGSDARLVNLGKTITVVTDANGQADFLTSIERSTGFDDDGEVTVNVTATAGTVNDTEEQDFSSDNPVNGGALTLVQTPDADQDNPVDPTLVDNAVIYDVVTTDGFGNRVGGEPVAVEVDENDAFIETFGNTPNSTAVSDFDDTGDLSVTSGVEGTVTLTGEWTEPNSSVYVTPTTVGARPGGNEVLEDSAEAEFYEIDFADSTFTIATNRSGVQPVGTPVTTVVTVVDQEGNPVEGLPVSFLRSGPGDQQDGDPNSPQGLETNENGQAFYSFVGTEAGTAQISAVITEDQSNSAPLRTLTTSVQFGTSSNPNPNPNPNPDTVQIVASARANNNGPANDRITAVTAPRRVAAGAPVRLFTRVNGEVQRLQARRLNSQGQFNFTVRDRNGNRQTVYWVTVGPRPGHTGDRSTNIRVR